jgi:hypothetical protein
MTNFRNELKMLDDPAEPHREELADDDAQHDGDEQLRQQSELEFFLFHKNKILLFLS